MGLGNVMSLVRFRGMRLCPADVLRLMIAVFVVVVVMIPIPSMFAILIVRRPSIAPFIVRGPKCSTYGGEKNCRYSKENETHDELKI